MLTLAWVALGGAVGSVARYGVGVLVKTLLPGHTWPVATFGVNLLGAFAIGVLFVLLERQMVPEFARYLLVVGLLGGFTTFSTFSLELMHLASRGAWGHALGYALLSVLSCLLGAVAGAQLVRSLT